MGKLGQSHPRNTGLMGSEGLRAGEGWVGVWGVIPNQV